MEALRAGGVTVDALLDDFQHSPCHSNALASESERVAEVFPRLARGAKVRGNFPAFRLRQRLRWKPLSGFHGRLPISVPCCCHGAARGSPPSSTTSRRGSRSNIGGGSSQEFAQIRQLLFRRAFAFFDDVRNLFERLREIDRSDYLICNASFLTFSRYASGCAFLFRPLAAM